MLDKLTLLLRFRSIVEAGSLRGAAQELGITQPALSRSLAQLERYFGQPLLERQARGVTPTRFGREALSAASRIIRDCEIAENHLKAGGSAHVLRIQAGPLWRAVVLPELLVKLLDTSPTLTIELQNATAGQAQRDLLEGRTDVLLGGIYIPNGPELGLVVRPFAQIRDRIVVRADHPLISIARATGRIPVQALHEFPWLVYTASPNYREETLYTVAEYSGRAPDLRLFSDSLLHILRTLQRSDCLCMLPEGAVAGTSNPSIIPLPLDIGRREVGTGAIYRSAMADWPPLEMLMQLCEEYFASSGNSTAAD